MRGVATALALLCGGTSASSGTAVSPPPGVPLFTVTGSGATMADFVVARPVTVDPFDGVVAGTGRYAGMQLWDLSAPGSNFLTELFTSRDLDSRFRPVAVGLTQYHGDLAPITFGRVTLRPGRRYRVLLMSDGATAVSIPLPAGAQPITVHTTTPFERTYIARTVSFGASERRAAVRLPLSRRRGGQYFMFASLATSVADRVPATVTGLVIGCYTGRAATCKHVDAYGGAARANDGATPLVTSGSVSERAFTAWHRDARAEAEFSGSYDGTLTLVLITFDRPR